MVEGLAIPQSLSATAPFTQGGLLMATILRPIPILQTDNKKFSQFYVGYYKICLAYNMCLVIYYKFIYFRYIYKCNMI